MFGDDSFIRSFVLACCDRLDKVGTDRPQQNLVLHEKTDAFALPRVAFRSQRSILLVFFGVSAVAPFWFVLLASHRVANKQTNRQRDKRTREDVYRASWFLSDRRLPSRVGQPCKGIRASDHQQWTIYCRATIATRRIFSRREFCVRFGHR